MEGYLQLHCGEYYKGEWLTESPNENINGEIVFFTGMTGYQEVLTDPSYKDQIIVFTYPLIGNYGINEVDFENKKPQVAGVIVYEAKQTSYHYEAKYTLKDYLQKWNIPMLGHIDTRAVVKKIRREGNMPAILSNTSDVSDLLFSYPNQQMVSNVTAEQSESVGNGTQHIVLLDFGTKKSIVNSLVNRDCKVTTVPYNSTFEKIKELKPDGIVLSNGPGDPKDITEILPTIQNLYIQYPTLGIGLGHQLVALALGADTEKLAFGHSGTNLPVIDLDRNKVFMSSQNHRYIVQKESLNGTGLQLRFKHLHDDSVEGLTHEIYPLQTVQFHPEANPGPLESGYIFDEFIDMIKANNRRVYAYA